MQGNADILASLSIVDAMRFIWPYNGSDTHQQRYNRIAQMISDASGIPDAEVRGYLKYARIKSGKQDGGELTALFIGGKLCKHVPVDWIEENISRLTELHVKVWLIDKYDGAHNAFIDEVYNAKEGRYKPGFYGPETGRGRNERGAKGLTFGTDKAGLHITVNRYRDCRTHVEGHITGQVLRAIIDEEKRRQGANYVSSYVQPLFSAVQYQAAYRTAGRVLSAVRSRGVRLTDHFTSASDVSWKRPIYSDNRVPLDDEEERIAAAVRSTEEGAHVLEKQTSLPLE